VTLPAPRTAMAAMALICLAAATACGASTQPSAIPSSPTPASTPGATGAPAPAPSDLSQLTRLVDAAQSAAAAADSDAARDG
jgi:hypothetical protein